MYGVNLQCSGMEGDELHPRGAAWWSARKKKKSRRRALSGAEQSDQGRGVRGMDKQKKRLHAQGAIYAAAATGKDMAKWPRITFLCKNAVKWTQWINAISRPSPKISILGQKGSIL